MQTPKTKSAQTTTSTMKQRAGDTISLDDFDADLMVELPSKGKTIKVVPYLPSERLPIAAELQAFTTDRDSDEADASKMDIEKARAFSELCQRIVADVCFIGGDKVFADANDKRLAKLHQKDLEAIVGAAMSGGAATVGGFCRPPKKSK